MKKTNFILLKKRGPSISSDWVRRLYNHSVYMQRSLHFVDSGGMIRHEPALRLTFLFTSNVLDKDDNLRGESSEFPYYHTDTWTICWADFLKKFPKMRALSRRRLLNSYWRIQSDKCRKCIFLWVNRRRLWVIWENWVINSAFFTLQWLQHGDQRVGKIV